MTGATADISISLGTLVEAQYLCDKFNLAARNADAREKAAAALGYAVDFMDAVTPKLQDGWTMEFGNEWDGPDLFLDLVKGKQIAENRAYSNDVDAALERLPEFKSVDVKVNDGIAFQLEGIRQAYNLASDLEAARLAMTAFGTFKDLVWRENSFSFDKNGKCDLFDAQTYKITPLTF